MELMTSHARKADRTVCIIPARGGSKRIPRKNMRLLNGKPLLVYTISAAVESDCFSDIYVSSDDSEILDIAKSYGACPDVRPADLGGDSVKAVDVLDEFLNRKENQNRWNNIALCLPTCPFRSAYDIRCAMDVFTKHRTQYPRLVSVTQFDFPPQLALKQIGESSIMELREQASYKQTCQSQGFDKLYHPNGLIYLAELEDFLKNKDFFVAPMNTYIVPIERSFDIDYPHQFAVAECLMKIKGDDDAAGKQA